MDAAALIAILKDANAPEFKKAKACQRIGELAAKDAVPALAALLADEHLAVYARYGLEPITDPAVDEALRSALTKLKGNFLIGVVNSINKRRDAKAAPALVKLMHGPDPDVARAAIAALGSIGSAQAAKDLQAALPKTTGLVRMAVGDAVLVCAERMLADGKRDDALALYGAMSAPNLPKPVRLAAMSGIIREETSVTRPK
jgi:HEAT repeat protein